MKDFNLRKLQLIQLDILKDFDEFCSKYELRYYIVAGTLLGAIRHKGFIPWDDDLDVAMYRKDYEIFNEKFPLEFQDKYFLQNPHTDKNYPRLISKIRLNGTRQVEKVHGKSNSHQGIYIDVFPLDGVSRRKGIGLSIRGGIIRGIFSIKTARIGTRYELPMWKQIIKKVWAFFTLLVPRLFVNWLLLQMCTLDKNKVNQYTTSFLSGYGWKKQLFASEVYGDGKRLLFEGYLFMAPEKPTDLLEGLYGNFLELPPEEKRYRGHDLTLVDFGPYDNSLEARIINDKAYNCREQNL